MTIDDYKVSKDILVQFDGVPCGVRPNVEYLGKRTAEMPSLAKSDGMEQLYSGSILYVIKQLKEGKEGYDKLSENQPLVKSGSVTKESMKDFLDRFMGQFNEYFARSELLDLEPEKRIQDNKMQEFL